MYTRSSFRMIRFTIVALGLAASFLSCDAGSSGDSRVSVVDSAGVEIVESRRPLWGDGDEWRISDAPVLQIGTVTGDPAYELHRVAGVVRFSDGRIVVANGGSSQLRFYDAKGVHLRDVGRQGEGPGEFQFLGRIWTLRADSLATYDDFPQNRVSVFDSQGKLVRSHQLQMVEGMGIPSARAGFSDGSILSVSGTGSFSQQEGRIEGSTWIYSRYSDDGSFLNKIGEGRGGPRWGTENRGRYTFPYLPLVLGIPPGGAGPNSLYLGEGTRLEVERRRTDGTLARIIRWNAERRPVSSEVVGRYKSYLAAQAGDHNRARQSARWVEEVPFPEQMPAYQSLKVDVLGNLWLEQYRAPWEDEPQWWVFDPEGRWLGELSIPKDFRIDEIGSDYLLGVRRDEDRVEYVTMFELRRGGP